MRYLIVILVAGGLVMSGIGVSTHGNHLTVDNQVSDDGTILIETLYINEAGYIVLHADDDGAHGTTLGHEPLNRGFHYSLTIGINGSYWETEEDNTTVWAVLYGDDGDGQFVPGEDQPLRWFGDVAGEQFDVRKNNDGKAYIVADSPWFQEVNGSVTIRDVALPENGYVVVREVDRTADNSIGEVVGRTSLNAGAHSNVTVEIDDSFYADQDRRFDLWAIVYKANSDGTFDPETDSPVLVDGESVMTRFSVKKADDSSLVRTPTEENNTLVNTPADDNNTSLVNLPKNPKSEQKLA